jgi:phosphoglycolate phosphatase-like HAD superfamily hydrolase
LSNASKSTQLSNLVIFDLDGVITCEDAYWDAAGLVLHELLYSPLYWHLDVHQPGPDGQYHPVTTAAESRRVSRAVFPETDILALKARAVNTNWDTCYATVCLHLIPLLAALPDLPSLLPLQPWDAAWLTALRERISYSRNIYAALPETIAPFLDTPALRGKVGFELLNRFDVYASEVLGHAIENVFSRYSPFWTFCQDIFQQWYLGDELYAQVYGHAPAQRGKPGCIHFEQPLLPVEQIRAALETLRQQGYVSGIATGRRKQEALIPLKRYGLLPYLDERHIATSDDVERAEAILRACGDQTLLNKPHPFVFLHAAGLSQEAGQAPRNFIVVGDSTSDILGGRAAGALTVAVLTGARTAEARALLAQSKPDFTIEDVTKLPELLQEIDSLATIQRLQFAERAKAERLLQRWFARHMHLNADSVTLTPKPVSLNSFNGFYRTGNEAYFFKTHVEEQGVLQEYYHAELLHRAGYNVVQPLRTLHEEGRQMVIYPVVRWPVMFDLMRALETGSATDIDQETLIAAEQRECERLLTIYQSTLAASTAAENARAPIHQLFWHRLAGVRFQHFYTGKPVPLPASGNAASSSASIPFDELLRYRWVINGVIQPHTSGELIQRALVALHPEQAAMTVTGHGDAHFGNVFLENRSDYLYFDPAFAGRHSPLLDLVKPLYHNVFATWMYFPQDVARELHISVYTDGETVYVEHDYALSPVRRAMLRTKLEYLIKPLVEELREALPENWQETLRLALLCCPLLTVNLLDEQRIPAAISWLGLSQAVQLGNGGVESWKDEL